MTVHSSADELHRRWRAFEVPDGDVVAFADGTLVVMDLVRHCAPDGTDGTDAQLWEWYELLRATEWSPASWIDADCVLAVQAHAGFRAVAGESAAHGGIGWVALTHDDRDATLQWLAVSRSSDPFSHVTLSDTELTAVSTAGRVWAFPRDAPQRVRITPDPEHPRPWEPRPPGPRVHGGGGSRDGSRGR